MIKKFEEHINESLGEQFILYLEVKGNSNSDIDSLIEFVKNDKKSILLKPSEMKNIHDVFICPFDDKNDAFIYGARKVSEIMFISEYKVLPVDNKELLKYFMK